MPRMPAARGYTPGFQTVAPAPTPRIVQGPSVARAMEGFGQTVERIGADMQQTEDRRAAAAEEAAVREARQRDAEARAEQAAAAAEQKRINRLKAANAATELEMSVDAARGDLDDQLARGAIKPEAYQSKLQEFIGERQGKLRNSLDPSMHLDFDEAAKTPIRRAQLGTIRALSEHRKREAVAELDKARENVQRIAVKDLPRALAMGAQLYSREGPYAAQIGIDQAQKQGQAFRENATRVHFLGRVANSQNDARALSGLRGEISGNADLDPTQQAALIGQIDSRTSVLENKAIAAGERQARKQDQAYKAIQDLDAQGLPLSPAFVSQQMAILQGSPLAEAAAGLIKGAAATAAFGSKTVPQQNAIIEQAFAQARATGVDPASSKHIQKLVGIRNATEAAVKADPWRAANERGQLDAVPPLDMTSVGGMAQSLQARMAAAPIVDQMAGRTVSPLRPAEADGLAETINALPVPERTKMLGAIQTAIGPERMRAVAEQLKNKDGTLGIAAAYQALDMKTETGVNLGEIVLRGAEARKNKTVKIDEAAETGLEAQVRKAVEGAYATPGATNAAVEASMTIWAGLKADGRSVSPTEAVRIATGGVTEHNGQKIPMPYGWDDRRVKRSIASITPEYVQAQAGSDKPLWIGSQQMLPEDVARMIPRAQLRSAGPGRYAIRIGDNLVTTDGRRPFTIALPTEEALQSITDGAENASEMQRLQSRGAR